MLTLHEVLHWGSVGVLHADELRDANLLILDAKLGLHPNLGLLVIHSINQSIYLSCFQDESTDHSWEDSLH